MYIEREALITKLNDIAIDLLKDNSIQCTLAAGTVVDIKDNVVAKQPTADVAEVRHGKWLYHGTDDNDMVIVKCSECNTKRYGTQKYCGECGAKMDGKEEK